MNLIVAISFKHEKDGIGRWIYLNVFQENISCGSNTYHGL